MMRTVLRVAVLLEFVFLLPYFVAMIYCIGKDSVILERNSESLAFATATNSQAYALSHSQNIQ